MWDKIKSGASAAWDGITSVFGVVVDWFREKFSAAWQAVKDVFSTGGKIFDGIKDGIVSVTSLNEISIRLFSSIFIILANTDCPILYSSKILFINLCDKLDIWQKALTLSTLIKTP